MISRYVCIAVGVLALCSVRAGAQVPFIGGGGTAFDPQIDVVSSGVLLDAQVVVSADRKYVTLNARPQQSAIVALRNFQFQGPAGLGFVGIPPAVNAPAVGPVRNNAAVAPTPATSQRPPTILERRGMTRMDNRAK